MLPVRERLFVLFLSGQKHESRMVSVGNQGVKSRVRKVETAYLIRQESYPSVSLGKFHRRRRLLAPQVLNALLARMT